MAFFETLKCGQCQTEFGLTAEHVKMLRASSQAFYCPWGHARHFAQGESETDRLRRERDQLKQQMARVEEERVLQRKWRLEAEERTEAARRQTSAMKGQVTRLKNRAANGVCPCCNRTFTNLQRHMASKHAGFVAEEVTPEGATIQ